jgi:HK97 family phage major capsid protein
MNIEKKAVGEAIVKLVKSASGNYLSGSTADGAALVATYLTQVLKMNGTSTPILDRVLKINVPDGVGNIVKVPSNIDPLASDPATGTRAYWVEEAAQKTISIPQWAGNSQELKKLVVRVPYTWELEDDVERLVDIVVEQAQAAINIKLEQSILYGMAGGVSGVMGAGDKATLTVTTAGTPTEANLAAYVDVLHPSAHDGAVWLVTKAIYSALIKTNYTTDNVLTFEDGQYFLFGFPLVVHPALVASPYHIVLGDFSRYFLATKAIKTRNSDAIRFLFNESEIRIELYAAGNTFARTSTLDDSVTYGWYIVPAGGEALASSSSESSSSDSSRSSQSSVSSLSSGSSQSTQSSQSSVSSLSSNSSSSTSSTSSHSSQSSDSSSTLP